MDPSLTNLTLAEASSRIAAKDISPLDLVKSCIARIEAVDPKLASFVTITRERALADARRAEDEIQRGELRGPLHGIPYALKDIFETKGIRTTAHSRSLATYVPAASCEVEQRLAQAGGVLLGKTATWEFAHGGPSWDLLFPPAKNPWQLDRDPGGSSSGSAAAVAAGLCLAAMGSDTGGSIRSPAAACGVAGLKPTFGRVSRRGVLPNSFSHDHCGPLAWTVEDVAMVLQVVAAHDRADPASADVPVPDYRAGRNLRGLVIGVPYRWIEEEHPASPEIRNAFDAALRIFLELGALVRPLDLPALVEFEDVKKIIAACELFAAYGEALRRTPELFGGCFRSRVLPGALVRAEEYILALQKRALLARKMQRAVAAVDVVMTPTEDLPGPLQPTRPESLFTSVGYLTAFNVSGHPALALCMGYAENGLPMSLQIVGGMFEEPTVLACGRAYEQATAWRATRPSLH